MVLLQTAALLRVDSLDVSHELAELLARDPRPLGQILRDRDGRLLQKLGVLQDFLAIAELLDLLLLHCSYK